MSEKHKLKSKFSLVQPSIDIEEKEISWKHIHSKTI